MEFAPARVDPGSGADVKQVQPTVCEMDVEGRGPPDAIESIGKRRRDLRSLRV
jgi:hypothetical protein